MRGIGGALGTAVLLFLAFPGCDQGWVAWIALTPLLLAVAGKGLGRAFALAFLAGLVFFMGHFAWIFTIRQFRPTEFVLLGCYLASYWGLWGAGLSYLGAATGWPAVVWAPPLWVGLEYLRAQAGFLALPWGLLGQSQYLCAPVRQLAAITGVYGLSFVVVLVNAAVSRGVATAWAQVRGRQAGDWPAVGRIGLAAGLVLALVLTYGYARSGAGAAGTGLRVGVVQGNIPQVLKWEASQRLRQRETYATLTRVAAAADRPGLVVWPETALTAALVSDPATLAALLALARETGSYLLVGNAHRSKLAPADGGEVRSFNSVSLISPTGKVGPHYHKVRLVPFGEYLPVAAVLPWPSRWGQAAGRFRAGGDYTVFEVAGTPVGVAICWEVLFPDHCRRLVQAGARLLVNVTNEAWFGDTAAPRQLLAMSVFRAVENNVPLVRAANTGISAFISPTGEIRGRVRAGSRDLLVPGCLTLEVAAGGTPTFYARHGDVFALVTLGVMVLLVLMARRPTCSTRTGPRQKE